MDLPDKTAVPAAPKKEIRVIAESATRVKRPATRRFMDYLFAESPRTLGKQVKDNVVVPRLKAAFEEAANGFLSGMLWGDGSTKPMSNVVRGAVVRGGAVTYATGVNGSNSVAQARQAVASRDGGNYQDIVLPSQQIAENILAYMYDLLNQYNVVAVADLYESANLTPAPSDNAYGWRGLDGARITKVRDGFCLELPRPHLI